MKSRPRSVEREVAKYLSEVFVTLGYSPVRRIPTTGRTGPDISINEARFVIDVKSRIEVPKMMVVPDGHVLRYNHFLVALRLKHLSDLLHGTANLTFVEWDEYSRTVEDWWRHMDEWTQENEKDAITTLILHRPRMLISNAALVMSYSDYQNFRRPK